MDIQSRLLTVDFYDCKGDRCGSVQTLQESVSEALRTLNLTPLQIISSKQNSGHISLLALLPDGHIAVHLTSTFVRRTYRLIPLPMQCAGSSSQTK